MSFAPIFPALVEAWWWSPAASIHKVNLCGQKPWKTLPFFRKPPKDSDNFKVGSSYLINPYHIFIVPQGWNSQSHLKPRFRPIAGRSKTRRAWHAKETPAAWGLRGDASESLDPSSAKGASKDVDLHGWQILYTNMCPRKIFKGIQVSNKDKWIATLHIGASGPNRNGKGVVFVF